jgi:hypothetical protein
MTPITDRSKEEVIRKFKRLKQWTEHFNLVTCIDEILCWVESGPHPDPTIVNRQFLSSPIQGFLADLGT